MLVDVVCLRREGVKLPDAETKAATPVRGHLRFGYWIQTPFAGHSERRRYQASIHRSTDTRMPSLLPELNDAVVSKIDIATGSMLIVGTETIRIEHQPVTYAQTWWCRQVDQAASGLAS